ncbi:MAG: Hsp20/alpha crystallin family protein [Deltaproteobacteria bacterium]|nr:Hsp20/alpha crystallin family protein [Deltaproteobacteria bacterium]
MNMFALKKWEPLGELSTLKREMDELFNRAFSNIAPGFFKGGWYPSVESYVKGGNLVVKADLPGIDPKEVDISIVGNTMTRKGERKEERKEEKGEYFFRETSYDSFERTLTLPAGVETDKVHASYRNGVIEITMPAKGIESPKKITVGLEKETKKAA